MNDHTADETLPAGLRSGARVQGLAGPEAVTVRSVDRLGDDAWEVLYRDDEGRVAEKLVYREDLVKIHPVKAGSIFSFDADGGSFRLASEARRMRLAHLFDPQAALGTSDVDPLPHQLKAVYEEMLSPGRLPLRYVLADDPGAGKTIMAGLLIKELVLRGAASNVLVVAPGSLVDQWQDELAEKFGLDARILSREHIDADRNPFHRDGLWIARLDMLARNSQGIQDKACAIDWDLVIVDEAHKMSANVWAGEVNKTKRYILGERLGQHTRDLLLMTATPHSGKEEQFQLFMGLLDPDRFERAGREGTRRVDVSDLMRRMVKEDLLTFEGTKLFPQRRSYTVQYELTGAEKDLYADVTDYVRNQMNMADAVQDGGKRRAVGFALTTLQRRLASSPTAIHRSLERRLNRLRTELAEARMGVHRIGSAPIEVPSDLDDERDTDDYTDAEREAVEDEAVSAATAARTVAELQIEVGILEDLVDQSARVKSSPSYAKWDKLREVLDSDDIRLRDESGQRRKLIIFTEHKDTLNDLTERLRAHLGRDDAVVVIHGGVRREDRKKAQETFKQDDQSIFLVATDAAGEGVNLQNAHLLINFDLPWNPNRIEQRFGRIHRIKQQNVCHMWSLLAKDTREGDVYTRLLEKLEQQRSALGGRVFDVLGQVFDGNKLRDLMIDAIKYGDDPARQAELFEIVDASVGDGIQELLDDQQLVATHMDTESVDSIRLEMERAEAARLQPHHVEAYFLDAFTDLNGTARAREHGRYELRNIPARIRERDRVIGRGIPVVHQYHRITFNPATKRVAGFDGDATLMHPGHPLMLAMTSLITDDHANSLRKGTILYDRSDASTAPYLVCMLEHDMVDGRHGRDGQPLVISSRVQYLRLDTDGTISAIDETPIPNLEPLPADVAAHTEKVTSAAAFNATGIEQTLNKYAAATVARDHANAVTANTQARVDKTRRLVRERLTAAIRYWDGRAAELHDQEKAGKNTRLPAREAQNRADELTRRLQRRMGELDKEEAVSARAPRITGALIVVPHGWGTALTDPEGAVRYAKETERVERAAVDAVLAIETAQGHTPREMARNNPGYDIESGTPAGLDFIEVKGRIEGAEDFIVTRQEIVHLLNKSERAVLALAEVAADGSTRVRYVRDPMTTPPDPRTRHTVFKWADFWHDGQDMHP